MTLPLPGPEKGACGCGCDAFGTLRRPWSDGTRCVRGCPCSRCMGKRNRAKGDAKARKARQVLGLTGVNTRHEEHWGGPLRVESKAGKQVQPIWTRYQAARSQSEAARPIGDTRPFVMVAAPDGVSEFLLVVSSADWTDVVDAYR